MTTSTKHDYKLTLTDHVRHALYLLRHKIQVLRECCKLGIPVLGLTHDVSKFHPREWVLYVQAMTIPDSQECAKRYHWPHNPHHFEYWITDTGLPIAMPHKYRCEMLADWISASRLKKNDLPSWYDMNKQSILLHPETRIWIEQQLNKLRRNS